MQQVLIHQNLLKSNLASLKCEVDISDIDKLEKVPTGLNSQKSKRDKLDVDKLVPIPVDLHKLTDVVKNYVLDKTEYDELVKKVNAVQTNDTSNLVKKTAYDIRISEIEKKNTDHDHSNTYITTKEFNKLTAENLPARLKQANLATKVDINDFVYKTDFDDKLKNSNKVISNKTKNVEVEKKLTDLKNKVAQISENG